MPRAACFQFQRSGSCSKGRTCTYLHDRGSGGAERGIRTNGRSYGGYSAGFDSPRPSGACFQFTRSGSCSKGDACTYRHDSSASSFSSGSSSYSPASGVCFEFERTGSCSRGDGCQYRHAAQSPGNRKRSASSSVQQQEFSVQSKRPRVDESDAGGMDDGTNHRCCCARGEVGTGTAGSGDDTEESISRLNTEQRKVFDLALAGHSVYFSGPAGTGKSFTVECLVAKLRQAKKKVYVCGSTGVAAMNVGGITLHSWAGVGLGQEAALDHYFKIIKGKRMQEVRDRWCDTDVLVIDEISMISGQFFDKLGELAQRIRITGMDEPDEKTAPWGGIQLICVGDFHQLPPVWHSMDTIRQKDILQKSLTRKTHDGRKKLEHVPRSVFAVDRALFCFEADSWDRLIAPDCIVELRQVYRQRDAEFLRLLTHVRHGCEAPGSRRFVQDHMDQLKVPLESREELRGDGDANDIKPTRLFTTNRDVDDDNLGELRLLPDRVEYEYNCVDLLTPDNPSNTSAVQKALNGEEELFLRKGAQVMLQFNVSVTDGLVNGSRGVVTGFCTKRCKESEAFKLFASSVSQAGQSLILPVVKFASGQTLAVCPVTRSVELAGRVQGMRTQLPLKLAWAVTVHKSQGLSLDRVEAQLDNCFSPGQGYVALSRCRSLEGLEVSSYTSDAFECDPVVRKWHVEHGLDTGTVVASEAASGTSSSQPPVASGTSYSPIALGGSREFDKFSEPFRSKDPPRRPVIVTRRSRPRSSNYR